MVLLRPWSLLSADELLAATDFEGCRIWKRILEAVAELTRTTPVEGERVN